MIGLGVRLKRWNGTSISLMAMIKGLRQLQRKLLFKHYGLLAFCFLKIVSPANVPSDTLAFWHPQLMAIKRFSDMYGKLIIFTFLACTLIYSMVAYLLSIVSLDEMLKFCSEVVDSVIDHVR